MMMLIKISLTCLLFCSLSCSHLTITSDRLVTKNGVQFLVDKDGSSDNPFTGSLVQNYPTGDVKFKVTFKKGIRQGPYEWYDEDGQLKKKGTNKDGKHHGPYARFYENGLLIEKGTYKDGKRHGPCESYHGDGRLKKKVTYKGGELHGISEEYYESGKLKERRTFIDGKEQ